VLKGFSTTHGHVEQYQGEKFAFIVLAILSGWDLDAQQGLFKLTMKSNFVQAMCKVATLAFDKTNPIIVNSLTCLW
jgi:hypothetical protein